MKVKPEKTFLSKLNRRLKLLYKGLELPFTPSRRTIKLQKKKFKIDSQNSYWLKEILITNKIIKTFYRRPELMVTDLEHISAMNFKARDGLTLSGLVYEPNLNSNKWVIACHWFGGHKNWALHHAIIFAKMGYNIMSFDFRNHGHSQKGSTTMGTKETNDIMGAVDWLKENRQIDSLAFMGTSMGAYAVNSASLIYKEELKKLNLKFVVSDATYGSVFTLLLHIRNVFLRLLSKKRVKKTIRKLIEKHNKHEKVVNLYETSIFKILEEKILTNLIPTLFFHSLDDKVTPPSDTYELLIKRNTKNDEYVMFNYAMHAQIMRLHFKAMNYKIAQFILKFDNNQSEFDKVVEEWNLLTFDKKDEISLKLK